jgi:hypothetical protein
MFEQLSIDLRRTELQVTMKSADFQQEILCNIRNGCGIGLADSIDSSTMFCQIELPCNFLYLARL